MTCNILWCFTSNAPNYESKMRNRNTIQYNSIHYTENCNTQENYNENYNDGTVQKHTEDTHAGMWTHRHKDKDKAVAREGGHRRIAGGGGRNTQHAADRAQHVGTWEASTNAHEAGRRSYNSSI